jgi:outer membrane protein
MNYRTLALVLVLAGSFTGRTWAQTPTRIGIIDLKKVFDNYWKKKQAEAVIKDRFEGIQKDLKDMDADYQKTSSEYEKAVKDAADTNLSAEERDKRKKNAEDILKKLKDIQTDATRYRQRALENLDDQKKRLGDKVLEEIREAVSAKARTAAFTCVINTAAEGIGGPVFLYTNGDNDLTDTVINTLNAGAPADPTASDSKKPDDTKAGTKKDGKK